MPDKSGIHEFLNWSKQRLDEMDATLASLEAKASQVKADVRVKADQQVAELKKRREEFQAKAQAQAEAGEAALQATKSKLDAQWSSFEGLVKTYFETVGKEMTQQQATFRDVAESHAKAWREAAQKFHDAAAKLAAEKRASVDTAVSQMRADAREAEARLDKMKQAGAESWMALSAALTQSRKAFDEANQKTWDALKRASPSKT